MAEFIPKSAIFGTPGAGHDALASTALGEITGRMVELLMNPVADRLDLM